MTGFRFFKMAFLTIVGVVVERGVTMAMTIVRIPVKTATYSSLKTATYSGGEAASDSGPNPPPSRTALMEGLWQN